MSTGQIPPGAQAVAGHPTMGQGPPGGQTPMSWDPQLWAAWQAMQGQQMPPTMLAVQGQATPLPMPPPTGLPPRAQTQAPLSTCVATIAASPYAGILPFYSAPGTGSYPVPSAPFMIPGNFPSSAGVQEGASAPSQDVVPVVRTEERPSSSASGMGPTEVARTRHLLGEIMSILGPELGAQEEGENLGASAGILTAPPQWGRRRIESRGRTVRYAGGAGSPRALGVVRNGPVRAWHG